MMRRPWFWRSAVRTTDMLTKSRMAVSVIDAQLIQQSIYDLTLDDFFGDDPLGRVA
jgi:hypothetical protein